MKKLILTASVALVLFGSAGSSFAQTSFFGLLTGGTSLQTFDLAGSSSLPLPVVGLNASDFLVDIDVRPINNVLYGMGTSGTLYTLTPTGVAFNAAVDVLNAIPGATAIDFNPAANRLRVYQGVNNFRLSPGTLSASNGLITSDGPLDYATGDPNDAATPNLAAAAYINSDNDPATGTTLYSIDPTLDVLVVHPASGSPQFSQLNTQNPLTLNGSPFNAGPNVGFDVLTVGGINTAYFSNNNDIYTIDLNMGAIGGTAGQLTFLRTVPGPGITDIAVVPEPSTLGLLGLATAGLISRRRRQV